MKMESILVTPPTNSTTLVQNLESSLVKMYFLGSQMSTRTRFTKTKLSENCQSICPTSLQSLGQEAVCLAVAAKRVICECQALALQVHTSSKLINRYPASVSTVQAQEWEAVSRRIPIWAISNRVVAINTNKMLKVNREA